MYEHDNFGYVVPADLASNTLAFTERLYNYSPTYYKLSPYLGMLGNAYQGIQQNGQDLATNEYLKEIGTDAGYSALGELAGDYLKHKGVFKIKSPMLIKQVPWNWIKPLVRGGLYGAAGAAAFEGGYELGKRLDNTYDISSYYANKLIPSVDPNSPEATSYRNTPQYKQARINSIIYKAIKNHQGAQSASSLFNR